MSTTAVYITGGTGFVGRALTSLLLGESNESTLLPNQGEYQIFVQARMPSYHWHRSIKYLSSYLDLPEDVEPAVIINLAGASIADKRWSDSRKHQLEESRIRLTDNLLRAVKRRGHTPRVLINASAIGYYGVTGDREITESAPAGTGFAAELCEKWEASADQFAELGTRVCKLRIGVVLGLGGGALAKMLPLYRLGLGGPISDGKQWFSWIHMVDLVRLIVTVMSNEEYSGIINATSPNPVRQVDFAKALGDAISRPAFMVTPAFALKLAFGQMASELLIGGQKVLPVNALQRAFVYNYPDIENALKNIFKNKNTSA